MSDFLFAQPSLISGLGRCLDIGGTYDGYNVSATPEQADSRALAADFAATGGDMRSALKQFAAGRE